MYVQTLTHYRQFDLGIQWTLVTPSSLGPEKLACFFKNKPCYIRVTKTIQYRGNLKSGTTKLTFIMKVCYISVCYNNNNYIYRALYTGVSKCTSGLSNSVKQT